MQHQPNAVEIDCVEVSHDISKDHRDVVLTGDVFFLQGHPFLVTLLCVIKFNAVEDLFDMTTKNLEVSLECVFNLHSGCGFCICDSSMHLQFKSLRNLCSRQNVNLNVCSADQCVWRWDNLCVC